MDETTVTDWDALRSAIDGLRRAVEEEIRAYPAPIPACDAQFNRLLELRQLLPRELERLEAGSKDTSASVEAFVRASPCGTEVSAALKP